MGMFDYIKSEMPLPDDPKPPTIEWFQTKDVPTEQLYLEKWLIRADGKLVKLGVRYEDRSDKSAPEGSFERIAGMMTPVAAPELDETCPDFDGDVSFGHYDTETKEWWDYIARFADGTCTKIWLNEHEPATNLRPGERA